MAGHAGLHRVVKTVKGKKGSAHRAYWVKNDAGPAAHPGIVHRAAVFAGKAALATAAVAATAYLAHKAGSHLAAHAGGGAGRGVMDHARQSITAGVTSGISKATSAAAAHGIGTGSAVHGPKQSMSDRFWNSSMMHRLSNSSMAKNVTQSINLRLTLAHQGIAKSRLQSIGAAPRPPSSSGSRSESNHPHFGAGGMEPARAVHFGAGGAEPSRRRGISAANSHALAAEFALDRTLSRRGRR